MKSRFIKIILPVFFISIFYPTLQSCTENETEPDPAAGLIKITEGYASGAAAKFELYAQDDLFAGYNPLFVALYDSISGKRITDSRITLYPLMNMETMSHSCPVENPGTKAAAALFPAGILFTMPSGDMGTWTMEVRVDNFQNSASGKAVLDIFVKPLSPPGVISFVTEGGEKYYLGYHFPEKMKVGVNPFQVIAYTREGSEFIPAENLSMKLTPEMPSMNHGSPNNEDPIHIEAGHYSGKVNFTMTGEWRLNLELSNGSLLLGTKYFDVIVQ